MVSRSESDMVFLSSMEGRARCGGDECCRWSLVVESCAAQRTVEEGKVGGEMVRAIDNRMDFR